LVSDTKGGTYFEGVSEEGVKKIFGPKKDE
jgi:hypothetical protein